MSNEDDSIRISKQWKIATRDGGEKRLMADYCWSIERDLHNIDQDNQKRENFYRGSYVHEVFIFAVSLLNDLMKIVKFYETNLDDFYH